MGISRTNPPLPSAPEHAGPHKRDATTAQHNLAWVWLVAWVPQPGPTLQTTTTRTNTACMWTHCMSLQCAAGRVRQSNPPASPPIQSEVVGPTSHDRATSPRWPPAVGQARHRNQTRTREWNWKRGGSHKRGTWEIERTDIGSHVRYQVEISLKGSVPQGILDRLSGNHLDAMLARFQERILSFRPEDDATLVASS